jgi:hypothetical protein
VGRIILVVLRANTVLDSDVDLAEREVTALSGGKVTRLQELDDLAPMCLSVPDADGLDGLFGRPVPLRRRGIRALEVRDASPNAFDRLVRRSAYGQEILTSSSVDTAPAALSRPMGEGQVAIALPAVLETVGSLIPWLRTRSDRDLAIGSVVDYLLTGAVRDRVGTRKIDTALTKRVTLHLAHDLHVYKAKFFPRFVGALLNIYAPSAGGTLLEPFSGSGTALFEAAIRGVDSVGFDLDPISAMISAAKVEPLARNPEELDRLAADVLSRIAAANFEEPAKARIPEEIRRRLVAKDAREGTAYVDEIETDAGRIRDAISDYDGPDRLLLNTLLSDALTKKVRYRFVGVGNGRYTFAVTKEPVLRRFSTKLAELAAIAAVLRWVSINVQPLGHASASVGDATDLPFPDEGADLIITSPPYLPASSGREHYALARAIPLALVDVATKAQLDALNEQALGGVAGCDCPPDPILHAALEHQPGCPLAAPISVDIDGLTAHGQDLLSFLERDPVRRLKHRPTAEYLASLRVVLDQCIRKLRPGARLLIVVPRETVFYESGSRETLFMCRAGDLTAGLAEAAGFEVEDSVDMELLKLGTPNARPRGLDAYYERCVVLRKPAAAVALPAAA